MSRLELFKPLKMLKDKSNPIIFDELGLPYPIIWQKNKGLRPFVIFYDEKNDTYWYIKSRDALRRNQENYKTEKYKNEKYKITYKGEILIKESNIGLFEKESYVDCSQIFKIDANLLESLVDKENVLYKTTLVLDETLQKIILNKINKFVNEEPPYLSIIEVYKIGNELKANSLYLCPEKFAFLEKLSDKSDWDDSVDKALSNAESLQYGEEYYIAIDFKKKFQEKCFPNQSSKMKM